MCALIDPVVKLSLYLPSIERCTSPLQQDWQRSISAAARKSGAGLPDARAFKRGRDPDDFSLTSHLTPRATPRHESYYMARVTSLVSKAILIYSRSEAEIQRKQGLVYPGGNVLLA